MKILVIGAHLDDIELACGGTLAKAVKNGHKVRVVIMSKSGYTNNDGKIQRSDEAAVKEGVAALKTLGLNDYAILDFPTKDIPFRSDVINAIDVEISGCFMRDRGWKGQKLRDCAVFHFATVPEFP